MLYTFKETLKAIFWNCIQYTIHWDKKIFKKIFFGQKNGTNNALFFLSWAQTHHIFTLNLRFLYELKHKVRLTKTVCGIFHFQFCFALVKVYIFVQQNAWILDFKNIIIPFKIRIIEKSHTVLLPDLWLLNCNKKFWNSMISAWVGAPQKLTLWQIF